MVELRQRLAGMPDVGIGHGRVLAHDVHAGDLPCMDGVHDLDDGEAGVRIELGLPQLLEPLPVLRCADPGVVGITHRDEAGVGGSLDVVLAAQRMEPGAGPAGLPAHQRERDQAAGVVGAVGVLRHAHAPEDDRRFGPRVRPGDRADDVGGDAADAARHGFGRETGEMCLQLLEAFGVGLDVLPVVELLGHDDVHHGVEQRHVAAVLELQHVGGVALQRLAARVHDDQRRAALGRLLEVGGGDGVVLDRVGADHHDDVGVPDRGEGRGDRARADRLHECGHRGGVAEPRAVVDVVASRSRCAPASGTDRPPRWSTWPSRSRRAPGRPRGRGCP